ncbi:ATP-binding cassette subfamily B protein [Dysgonomonas sp. PFB1-18]|nr:ATP-binding cassette subfamily B protein [Dysgonomonas sp. PF1-14]MDH6340774.1 ATP-binding cassette subfamily B protein [Dysgonomonas sp. PF1-16]MDH6382439.1 ATP-binding cassette subfamily B protein [Dysgonomonas sp. PFB1-18]
MNKSGFLKCWISSRNKEEDTGTALLLNPTPAFYTNDKEPDNSRKSIIYFFSYLKPYRSQIIQLIIGLLIGSILSLIFPFLTQSVVDQGIGNNNLNFITLVLIAQLTVEFIRNWITLHVNSRISISLISDFLAKLMKLPLRFFDSKNVGDIMQRVGDNNRIRSFLTGSTLMTLFSFVNFIIFAIILAYYNLIILGVFVLGNTLYILWIFLFLSYRRKLDMARFAQASANQSNLVQIVTGMQEIKLNNCEKQQRWRWERIQVKLFKIRIKGLALGQYQQIGSVFFSQTTSLFISFIAARSVIEGDMTLGMMMAVSYIIGQLSGPIGQVIGFVQAAQDAKISLERLNEIHNKEDEEQSIDSKINELPLNRSIHIEDIYFSYDGADRNYVLNGINLKIPENKITAIVGASGSGKTTLIKLLLAFYQPNKGTIKIKDIPINEINPHLWRKKSGAVMQDGFIFSDTIANNIAIGEDMVDKQRLLHAVEIANIKEFIESLPLKYNTKIEMEGNGISQGQRQRLLIARAVYKNPYFLFFDEATNALDANNEKTIMDNLNSFYRGKTVVIVAHRLSTVQNADNIVVLDKGQIIEEGTHTELTDKKGAYYTLVKNQLELGM